MGALGSVPAGADTGRPNAELGPTQVEVSIFLLDLDGIDSHAQSFQANVYFEATWKDPRLADASRDYSITRPMDDVWCPRFRILNQQRIWSSLSEVVEIEPDARVRQQARVWGDLPQALDLCELPCLGRVGAALHGAKSAASLPYSRLSTYRILFIQEWEI